MIAYFDSHCHLTDAAFQDDREAVFRRAQEASVTRLVCIASDLQDARAAVDLIADREGAWSTAGVHPHQAGAASEGDLDHIRRLASDEADVVAIGETGLDYHYDNAPRGVQRELFEVHLQMGADLGLPVVVHARDADDDISAALRTMPAGTRGVLHCFTGGEKAFTEAMSAGWYVSFSGIASFKSFQPVELLREVPSNRILIETDSPYLAPAPHRGKRNEPAHVVHVAEAVARHLGAELSDVALMTTENACRFYGVD